MNNKKQKIQSAFLAGFCLLLTAPSFGNISDKIPIVGTDDDGQPMDQQIPGAEYSDQMQAVVTTVNDSMMEALATQTAAASWKLTSVLVGVGISAEVGFKPLISAKVAPRFRIVFSKNNDPVCP